MTVSNQKNFGDLTSVSQEQNTIINPTNVIDKIISILPDIDPDSTRMVEWIWAERHRNGVSTYADNHTINDVTSDIMPKLQEEACKFFNNHYSSTRYFRGMMEDDGDKHISIYVVMVESDSGNIDVCAVGDKDKVTALMAFVRNVYNNEGIIETSKLEAFTSQGPLVNTNKMDITKIDEPHIEFYPWLEYESIEDLAEKFDKSKSNVLVILGDPGTGKSTIIRKLLFLIKREKIGMVDNASLLLDPALPTWLSKYQQDSIVVFEDADLFLGSRENGNTQMSMLLNMTNGLVQTNTKFIISTNLVTLKNVDPAILRSGRNFDILTARKLTAAEANHARTAVEKEPVEFDEKEKYTLSEALNCEDTAEVMRRRIKGVGFR